MGSVYSLVAFACVFFLVIGLGILAWEHRGEKGFLLKAGGGFVAFAGSAVGLWFAVKAILMP